MTVEHSADLVGDRLVDVVAFDEHRVDRRNRSRFSLPCSLQQTREHRERARWKPAARGRLACRETDLALSACNARDGVDEEHHPSAAVAEIFGVRGGDLRGAKTLERRSVARGDDDDAARAAFCAECPFEKFTDLATALADEADHDDIGGDAARHGAEERALADARSRKQADALAFAERAACIDRTDAGFERARDGTALERARRIAIDGNLFAVGDCATAVDRAAEAVDDATEQRRRCANDERRAGGNDFVVGADARERAERHGDGDAFGECDDLAGEIAGASFDVNDVTDASAGQRETQGNSRRREHAAGRAHGSGAGELGFEGLDVHAG